jgi:hypothetical protein
MIPLAIGLCLDFYLVASVIIEGFIVPILAMALFTIFIGLWFVLPRWQRLLRLLSK